MQQAGKAATKSAPQSPVVSAYSQSLKPKFNVQKTVTLFDHLSSKKLGDQFGAVQLRELGILVHPGVSSPTEAVFSINGQMNSTTFVDKNFRAASRICTTNSLMRAEYVKV